LPPDKDILEIEPFLELKKLMELEYLLFLKQVHGDKGLVLDSIQKAANTKSFTTEGDFIVTNLKHVGIGVVVADCLPIIFFDKRNQVISIVHAGWRGSVNHVSIKAIDQMQKAFGTQVGDIKVIFGPSAKVCCYKVGEDFLEQLQDFEFVENVVQRRSDGLYFDIPMFNMVLLEGIGIKKEAFQFEYNDCTVCNKLFYSTRRDGDSAGRNMVVAALT